MLNINTDMLDFPQELAPHQLRLGAEILNNFKRIYRNTGRSFKEFTKRIIQDFKEITIFDNSTDEYEYFALKCGVYSGQMKELLELPSREHAGVCTWQAYAYLNTGDMIKCERLLKKGENFARSTDDCIVLMEILGLKIEFELQKQKPSGIDEFYNEAEQLLQTYPRNKHLKRTSLMVKSNYSRHLVLQGQDEESEKLIEECQKIVEETGADRFWLAQINHDRGRLDLRNKRHKEALEEFEQALQLWEEIGNITGKADTNVRYASACIEIGEIETARAKLEEALAIYRETGNKIGEGRCLLFMADTYQSSDINKTKELVLEASEIFYEAENYPLLSVSYQQLMNMEMMLGNMDEALRLTDRSIKILSEFGSELVAAEMKLGKAFILMNMSRNEEASKIAHELIEKFPLTETNHYLVLQSLLVRMVCNFRMGKIKEAIGDVEFAIEKSEKVPLLRGTFEEQYAEMMIELGNIDEAITHVNKALDIYKKAGAKDNVATGTVTLSECYYQKGELERAKEIGYQGYLLFDKEHINITSAIENLIEIYLRLEEITEAEEIFQELLQHPGANIEPTKSTSELLEAKIKADKKEFDSALEILSTLAEKPENADNKMLLLEISITRVSTLLKRYAKKVNPEDLRACEEILGQIEFREDLRAMPIAELELKLSYGSILALRNKFEEAKEIIDQVLKVGEEKQLAKIIESANKELGEIKKQVKLFEEAAVLTEEVKHLRDEKVLASRIEGILEYLHRATRVVERER